MKKIITRLTLLLLLAAVICPEVSAQRYYHPGYHSRTGRVMRGLGAVETAYDYAMMGRYLNGISDYTGVRIGYNSASLRASGFDYTVDAESVPGLDVGIVFGWYLGRSPMSIEPGLFYAKKGGKLQELIPVGSLVNVSAQQSYSMHTFELPLVFKYHAPIAPNASLQPFAGAFMAFGFAGTYKDGRSEYDIYDDRVLEDFDAGLRFGVGLSAGHVYLEAAYDLGLCDLCDGSTFPRKNDIRSRTWSFNIGYNF